MLAIPPGGATSKPVLPTPPVTTKPVSPDTAINPATFAAPLTKAIDGLKPGQSATLTVTAGAKTGLSGLGVPGGEAQVNGSASVSVTNNGDGTYQVSTSQTQQAGVKVSSDEPESEGSGKKSILGTIGGLFLGPKPPDDEPPATGGTGTGKGTGTGVVPVAGAVGGITGITAPGGSISAQTKPSEEEEDPLKVGLGTTTTEPSGVESKASVSVGSTVNVTSTVTLNASNATEAAHFAEGFAQMATSPQPASLVNNPIMNQITGKSANVTGVSPATLDLMNKSVASYGETISGTSSVMAGVETSFGANSLTKSNIGVENDQQTSLSRTVTLPTGASGTDTKITNKAPASVAYSVSTQSSPQLTGGVLGMSMGPQGSQQVSSTQIYNLNSSKEVADPEGTLTSKGWPKPDVTQSQVQSQTQFGASTSVSDTSSGESFVDTTTVTTTQYGSQPPTVSTTQTAAENNTFTLGGDWLNANLTISTPINA